MWLRNQFEVSRGLAGNNMLAMEGIRGFAVFLVFVVHYATLVEPWITTHVHAMDLKRALHAVGNSGVDLFFVLSGYLIYGSLILRKQAFLPFIWRRVRRIYPTFIVVFTLYLALSVLYPADSKIPADTPVSYLLLNFLLLPGLFDINPMITVAWSLSYEMFFYLALPLLLTVSGLRNWQMGARIALIGAVAICSAFAFSLYGGHIRLIMFMAGILLFESIRSGKVRAPNNFVALIVLVMGLYITTVPLAGYVKIGVLFAVFYFFCLCCFTRAEGFLACAFRWTPLRWLGNMSYSYYLLHGLALKALFMMLDKVLPSTDYGMGLFLGLAPVMFVLTLLPSAVLFICVERPLSLCRSETLSSRLVVPT